MPSAPFRRILIGWDASPAAHTALTTAVAIADGHGTVIARAVLTPPPHTETGGEQNRHLSAQRHWLQEQFDQALGMIPTHGVRVCLEWGESDNIPDDLVSCAEHHGCDLIIIGRHGEDSHLLTSALGPVARALSSQTTLPVLHITGTRSAAPGNAP
ncbi:universal stress protein [Streptomyces sp. NPDC087894]|uniref:universal stress protein n=1 Tax=Streptomyces sp. NPDC087894 TaxID=3365816 RepID=UPI0037FEF1C8